MDTEARMVALLLVLDVLIVENVSGSAGRPFHLFTFLWMKAVTFKSNVPEEVRNEFKN